MSRDWLLAAMAMCDRHIAASHLHLAAQEKRIAAMEASGRDAYDSRSFLETLTETHRLHVEHRASIARELGAA